MQGNSDKVIYVNTPHAGRYRLDKLIEEVKELRQDSWIYKIWFPTPALVDRSDGSSRQFVGQSYDPKYFILDNEGWTHDHCKFCSQRISNIEGYGDKDGYVSNPAILRISK